ncbi:hypothetical protein NKR23_g7125 [Pleurostoma richardsiae]|uniref:Myb-like domain-containing protein n=1 Tax=Pleurostoma richardsiae TaxID=41990 RepID=A0AA38VDS0_9PEZI|nr:hypothetical protein NKR23_g7125 [Pleurostoma richardsiae]
MPKNRRSILRVEDKSAASRGPTRLEDCRVQISNLFIGAPVIVPKKKSWPSKHKVKKGEAKATKRVITVESSSDGYDSDDESDSPAEPPSPSRELRKKHKEPSSPPHQARKEQKKTSRLYVDESDGHDLGAEEQHTEPIRVQITKTTNDEVEVKHEKNGITICLKTKASTSSKKSKSDINAKGKGSKAICLKKMKDDKQKGGIRDMTDTGFDADTSSEGDLPKKKSEDKKKSKTKRKAVDTNSPSDASDEKTSSDEDHTSNQETSTEEASSSDSTTTTDSAGTLVEEVTQTNAEKEPEPRKEPSKETKSSPAKDTSNNIGPSATQVPNKNNFTLSQDAAIKAMKAGGEPWAAIAKATGRGKKELQHRWNELQLHQEQSKQPYDTENDADNELSPEKKKHKHKSKKKHGSKHNKQVVVLDDGAGADSGYEVDAGATTTAESETERLAKEEAVFTALYGGLPAGGDKKLRPDGVFSERDCCVLDAIDARRRVNRWLEVQAAFFNATGRMVDPELLRRKLEEDGMREE